MWVGWDEGAYIYETSKQSTAGKTRKNEKGTTRSRMRKGMGIEDRYAGKRERVSDRGGGVAEMKTGDVILEWVKLHRCV